MSINNKLDELDKLAKRMTAPQSGVYLNNNSHYTTATSSTNIATTKYVNNYIDIQLDELAALTALANKQDTRTQHTQDIWYPITTNA